MPRTRNADSKWVDPLMDFIVLGVTFFAACVLFSVELGIELYFHIVAYSIVLFVFVRLSKRAIRAYNRSGGETTRQILGNAAGILVGITVVLLFMKLYAISGEIVAAVIFSSVMAFFILGTLSPIVHKTLIVHK